MAPSQPDITSFFQAAKNKRPENSKNTKHVAKKQKVGCDIEPTPVEKKDSSQNTSVVSIKTGLQARTPTLEGFSRGNKPDPNFLSSHESQKRKEAFAAVLGKRERVPHKRELKPFDLQYIELKKQHMDAILVVMNGYRYCILGKDAYVASSALGTHCFAGWKELDEGVDPEDSLYSRWASMVFPTVSLMNYVQRLVAKNLKVAVADQVETAAVRASEGKSKGPFTRKVNRVFTKGTLVEEVGSSNDLAASSVSGHILSLLELSGPRFALVAIQLATGDGVYDEFSDSDILTELETRLVHIQPGEILKVGTFSLATNSLLNSISAKNNIRTLEFNVHENSEEALKRYPQDVELSEGCRRCFGSLVEYLEEFDLSRVFSLKTLKPFSLQSHMYLKGDTLEALEVFQNQTNFKEVGSLFWMVNCTRSHQGARQLRKWLACPLLDHKIIEERLCAVETLMDISEEENWSKFSHVLKSGPDLEQRLLQIYHGRIAPKQLYYVLQSFKSLASIFTTSDIRDVASRSPLLEQLMSSTKIMGDVVSEILTKINRDAATAEKVKIEDYFNFKRLEDSKVPELDELINLQLHKREVYDEFVEHVKKKALELNVSLTPLEILPGTTEALVIDVDKKDAKTLPKNWVKVNDTKLKVKMRSAETLQLLKGYRLAVERLDIVAAQCYSRFLESIACENYEVLREAATAAAKLDALWALATVSSRPGYSKPELMKDRCIDIEDGRHPMIEALMAGQENFGYIPNSVYMTPNQSRALVITGPNMGGKSSVVRQIALIVILGQVGCFVPAKKARFSPVDAIYTRMGANDNMIKGESTFMVEMKQCSEILAKSTENSLILMDEIGRGTSTLDGVVLAYSVLREIVADLGAFTLFITHYPLLNELAFEFPKIVTIHSMECLEDETTRIVTFLYKLVNKPASRSYGLNVARLAGISPPILEEAEKKSAEMEASLLNRRVLHSLVSSISLLLHQPSSERLIELRQSVDEPNEIPETQQ